MREIILNGHTVTMEDIYEVATKRTLVKVDNDVVQRIQHSRNYLEKIVEQEPIYGVTTGYGEMVHLLIDHSKEKELQTNLLRSHAACIGNHFSLEVSRAILATRINAFSRGYSAVRLEVVERLILFLNQNIIPIIPEIGSLGASGDLGQLAHAALPIIGEGYVFGTQGDKVSSMTLLNQHNLQPIDLKFKEGLALINGTSAMTGLGCMVLTEAKIQVKQAEIITALAMENQYASIGALQLEGHQLGRPHKGQVDCASNLLDLLEGSDLVVTHQMLKDKLIQSQQFSYQKKDPIYLQKAYTLRCVPQMIGAIKDSLDYATNVLFTEINSANDNPLFFEGKEVFHGGNFHGQPIAFIMDFIAIALTQLGVISERRINRLLNKHLNNGLPEFLIKSDPGLNCGFAGAQYPATALVAENRTICTPASIQSIPSNEDNQDVVSMGLIAARKCNRILKNNNYILAIELLSATQAIDLASHFDRLSPIGKVVHQLVRSKVAMLHKDRYMADDVTNMANFLNEGALLAEVSKHSITLR